ncbi:uroporphyrinogen-III C-methyltransferase [Brevibacillus nitrificans]|uniref:uroporphyrinogen-III C-methyltransferase n=1 Tax=Brevibacillus nitrificans TaxID=651560 RepID=UPI0028657AAB|nr:uroporphyrinogen-III C-methyltransferase [Brevibacillus nitrificans]MDR7314363.1 uroporphyrinogen III methyltransferase/synthase [Brevibacillus nitrificans]
MTRGSVWFVGAGPGDPKLLTIKGMEALSRADVVVYDRLANPLLLTHVKPHARLVYCGKEADRHTLPQEEINRLLVQEAQRGHTVVRLKGGDPSMFGRVGEEAQMCLEHGIPFEIVPGITSGMAVPLYAGIPLTHREYNSSVAFVTGHLCEKNAGKEPDWRALASMETLVIYMGVKNLPYIKEQLLLHGKHADTPVALVRWGTLGKQEAVSGRLLTIDRTVVEAGFKAPAIIVIGEVVHLRETLNWYEKKPLFGQRVAVASRRAEGRGLIQELELLGAEVWPIPLREQPAPSQGLPGDAAAYEWLVFDGVQQVRAFFRHLSSRRFDIRQLTGKIAAVGKETAAWLEEKGLYPQLVFEGTFRTSDLHQALSARSGERILHITSDLGAGNLQAEESAAHRVTAAALEWDSQHPAASWFASESFDLLATDDPDALFALAQFAGEDWQKRRLLCLGEDAIAQAKKMSWDAVVECEEGTEQLASVLDPLKTGKEAAHLYS